MLALLTVYCNENTFCKCARNERRHIKKKESQETLLCAGCNTAVKMPFLVAGRGRCVQTYAKPLTMANH